MTIFVELIAKYSLWLYGICALGVLICLRRALLARRERAAARFTLEKEVALSKGYRSLTTAILFLALGALVYLNTSFLEPRLVHLSEPEETPVALLAPTETPTEAPPVSTPTPTPTRERKRRRPTPISIVTPTPLLILPDCPNPLARLTYPTVDAVLKGNVRITGSANIENFWFYKLEYKSAVGVDEWHVIGELKEKPVVDGLLGEWDTSILPEGVYLFRLTVVDITGNYPPPCEVRVKIER
jgi:hypothetical protein